MLKKWKNLGIANQVLICVILGGIIGAIVGPSLIIFEPIGKMFIKAVQMMVIIIVGPAMISGFCSVESPKQIGKTGTKIILLFALQYIIACTIALLLVNIFKPGVGTAAQIPPGFTYTPNRQSFIEMITNIIPKNPVAAFAEGNLLQIVFVVVVFASIMSAQAKKYPTLLTFFTEFTDVAMNMLNAIMKFAPYAAGIIMAYSIGVNGPKIIGSLALFVVLIYAGELIIAGTNVLLVGLSGLNMKKYLGIVKKPAILAFTTSSSLAALPANIQAVEEAGVPKGIGIFGTTLGNVVGMSGTVLYQVISVVFIAQAYSLNITLSSQIVIALTAATVCVSLVGVPGAGTATIGILLLSAGLPVEGLGLVMAIDRIADMPRTMNNVFGDTTATIMAAKIDKLLTPDSPLLKRNK